MSNSAVLHRRKRGSVGWCTIATVTVATAISAVWQPAASATARRPVMATTSAAAVPVGTTSGANRTGLTQAGLASVTSLADAHVWVGLKNATDVGKSFDVQVQLLNNGNLIASGLRRCVSGLSTDPTKASDVDIAWNPFSPAALKPGDVLSLSISTRIGTNPDSTRCLATGVGQGLAAGLRVYYGAATTASSFGITITPDPSVNLSLASPGAACGKLNLAARTLTETPPTGTTPLCQASLPLGFNGNAWVTFGTWKLAAQCACSNSLVPDVRNNPPAPKPEPVKVSELPLPPSAPSATAGSCTTSINPHGTGCLDPSDGGIAEGPAYMWDNHEVLLPITFVGAPAAPDPASIYNGSQVIVIRTDGKKFSNGDPWKCITCGVPAANMIGASTAFDHPQAFHDGKRVLLGTAILDCSPYLVTDDSCTAAATHIYPIHSPSGFMRELRLNPDDMHLGWNALRFTADGIDELGFFGRLTFNPSPTTGTPLAPRYELTNNYVLLSPDPHKSGTFISVNPNHPDQLQEDSPAGVIGEFRGFTSDGKSAIGVGTQSSWNFDAFATNLQTGVSTRLTRDPAYTDPVTTSPDDNWTAVMDGRVDNRMNFASALPGVPPLVDLANISGVANLYNNGNRRFFEPYLIDRYGDRGTYHGQQLNACKPGDNPNPGSGSICDPLWNGRANPAWAPDGTNVVYWQALATAPACGPANPSVPTCPTSFEPGGRRTRLMIAKLVSRKAQPLPTGPVPTVSDTVPWGIAYQVGSPLPSRTHIPAGTYTLNGRVFGSATVVVTENSALTSVASVSVMFTNFSDDGINILNGTESGTHTPTAWHANLTLTGCHTGSEVTSEPGGFTVTATSRTGTLTTTVDGVSYVSPPTGT